jgi:hypothetical protein
MFERFLERRAEEALSDAPVVVIVEPRSETTAISSHKDRFLQPIGMKEHKKDQNLFYINGIFAKRRSAATSAILALKSIRYVVLSLLFCARRLA